jgi:PAS domain S-box-containing protein
MTLEEQALTQALAAALAAGLARQRQPLGKERSLTAYRMVLDAIVDPAMLIARDGSIRMANQAACALTQHPAKELERLGTRDLYVGLDGGMIRQLGRALQREQRYEIEMAVRCRDSSIVPTESTGYLVRVGGEAMCLALHRGLHETRRAEASLRKRLERLEALHALSAEMTAQWQADRLLESITERAITLLDASVGGLYLYNADRDLLELRVVHKLEELEVAATLHPGEGAVGQAFATQSVVNIPDYARYPNALPGLRTQVASVLAAPLRWQDRCLGVLLISDRAHPNRFAADDEHLVSLMTHHAAIVLTQAQLFAELQHANTELLQLDRMKDDLLAAVTHELQQPLTHARLNIDVLLQRPEQFSDEQRAMLTRAIYYIDVQHRLISDLLYMVSADRIAPEERVPLDLCPIVQDIFTRFRAEAESKHLAYALYLPDVPVECAIEPYSLERAIVNIIGNAIKFTREGHVHVRVSAEPASGQALVRVQDTGIGIAPDDQERIFQRFSQVDGGTTRAFGGLGIGLATAHRIITAHGGKIEVLSEPGVGSEFIIRLPLASAE